MLDMAGGVGPPDHRDNSANEQQQQKPQRIEPIRLTIPTVPVANHSTLPSFARLCAATPQKMSAGPKAGKTSQPVAPAMCRYRLRLGRFSALAPFPDSLRSSVEILCRKSLFSISA
jgi:hypothetical protein